MCNFRRRERRQPLLGLLTYWITRLSLQVSRSLSVKISTIWSCSVLLYQFTFNRLFVKLIVSFISHSDNSIRNAFLVNGRTIKRILSYCYIPFISVFSDLLVILIRFLLITRLDMITKLKAVTEHYWMKCNDCCCDGVNYVDIQSYTPNF